MTKVRASPRPELARAERIADRLHSAAIHLLRRLRKEDTKTGISAPRLSALSVVVFGGPLTLGALAAAEQVRPPTMTRLVDALERLGLVTRRSDPEDGRQILIEATPKGRTVMMAGRARRVASLAKAVSRLGSKERETLLEAASIMERMATGRVITSD
jgi:DNA-binding MarR family transcriptional regulator